MLHFKLDPPKGRSGAFFDIALGCRAKYHLSQRSIQTHQLRGKALCATNAIVEGLEAPRIFFENQTSCLVWTIPTSKKDLQKVIPTRLVSVYILTYPPFDCHRSCFGPLRQGLDAAWPSHASSFTAVDLGRLLDC